MGYVLILDSKSHFSNKQEALTSNQNKSTADSIAAPATTITEDVTKLGKLENNEK